MFAWKKYKSVIRAIRLYLSNKDLTDAQKLALIADEVENL